jgi:hypothetical protein
MTEWILGKVGNFLGCVSWLKLVERYPNSHYYCKSFAVWAMVMMLILYICALIFNFNFI